MKTIIIKDKKYNLPESWREVTFEQFIEIQKIDENINELYKLAHIVSILTNIDYNVILNMPFSEFNKLDLSWLNKIEKNEKNEWEIEGRIYKINSNLDAMTLSEFIDTQEFSKKIDDYPKLLGVLLRPVGEPYNSELVNERAELFKKRLNALDVYHITSFFLLGENGFITNSRIYLNKMMDMKKKTTGV